MISLLCRKFLLIGLGVVLSSPLLTGSLRADVVVDEFVNNAGPFNPTPTTPASTISTVSTNGYSRDFMASVNGDASMTTVIQDFNWIMDGNSTSGAFNSELEYEGFSLNLNSTPYLQFNINSVSGNPLLYVVVQNSSGGEVTAATQLNSSMDGETLTFDIRQMDGYSAGFLTGVNDLLVGVGGNGSPAFSSVQEIAFATVPEPATWLLILMGAGSLLFVRRRA